VTEKIEKKTVIAIQNSDTNRFVKSETVGSEIIAAYVQVLLGSPEMIQSGSTFTFHFYEYQRLNRSNSKNLEPIGAQSPVATFFIFLKTLKYRVRRETRYQTNLLKISSNDPGKNKYPFSHNIFFGINERRFFTFYFLKNRSRKRSTYTRSEQRGIKFEKFSKPVGLKMSID
jgi:hypothetical protein